MNRFRFSLGSFLAVVTLLAVGLSAMASQSRLAASAALTAYVVLICLALAGSVLPHSVNRPFWIGLAIFGWAYWFCEFDTGQTTATQSRVSITSFIPATGVVVQQPAPGPVGMLTQDLIDFLETNVTPGRSVGSKVMGQWRGGSYYSGTITEVKDGQYLIVWDDGSAPQWTPPSGLLPHSPSLRVAAHATIGGLFALLGGVIVALLFGPKSPPKTKDETPVSKTT
jgi:hypothetical protein